MSSDERAIEEVYAANWPVLSRLAFLLVGDRDDAQDVVNAAFLSATEHWLEIRQPDAYLRRAVVNRAKDLHRSAFRRRSIPRLFEREALPDEPAPDEIWAFVKALPPAQRCVVVLRYYEDLPLTDIADLLGRREATVRSDLRRALLNLRKLVK
ncbi:MAG: sigma-70 family RNA polymerase sigma factor [Actinomycetota bacterium]